MMMIKNRRVKKFDKKTAMKILKDVFSRGGYLRLKDENKLKSIGYQNYKKGFEIRFYPCDDQELKLLQRAIISLDLNVSKTFIKQNRVVQPLYGREITEKFKAIRDKAKGSKSPQPNKRRTAKSGR